MRKTSRSAALQAAVLAFGLFLVPGQISNQADNTRSQSTPPVVPETQTDPVRFEVTVTGGPVSVRCLPTGYSISILLLFAT